VWVSTSTQPCQRWVRVPCADTGAVSDVEDCDNINAYCSIDEMGRRMSSQMTLGEKEALFLESMSVRKFQGWSTAVTPLRTLQPLTTHG
jgi:hypothetical protein